MNSLHPTGLNHRAAQLPRQCGFFHSRASNLAPRNHAGHSGPAIILLPMAGLLSFSGR